MIATQDPELMRVGIMCARDNSPMDTANTFETEGVLEYLYALTAMGDDLSSVAVQLRMPITKIKMIMRSSATRRKRLLEAQMSELAEGSIKSLSHFKELKEFSQEEHRAAGHHRSMIDSATKLMTEKSDADNGPKVVVNNSVYIGEDTAPPPLPAELKGIVIDVNPQ